MLKVLKLEGSSGTAAQGSSNLSMNQTLEGHSGAVVCATWNPIYRKLTTSDDTGLIIVWMVHRGHWYEEMINNRNKSVVKDMKWTSDGKKICIAYEDGAVIVGSVDGNRLWGKDLNVELSLVEWSPNNRFILFATAGGKDVNLFLADGTRVGSLALPGRRDDRGRESGVVAMHWYDGGHASPNSSSASSSSKRAVDRTGGSLDLCLAYENGKIQISSGHDDMDTAVIVDTHLNVVACKWNNDGTVVAVSGIVRATADAAKPQYAIKFFERTGRFLRVLKVPGNYFPSLTWEGNGLRLALAVDAYIFFANVRPNYIWCAGKNTIVYSFQRPERKELFLVFWDTLTHERHTKHLSSGSGVGSQAQELRFLRSSGDYFFLVIAERVALTSRDRASASISSASEEKAQAKGGSGSGNSGAKGGSKFDDEEDEDSFDAKNSSAASKPPSTSIGSSFSPVTEMRYTLQMRNAIGAIIDSKQLPFAPSTLSVGPLHAVVANDRTVYTWQFQSKVEDTPASLSGLLSEDKDEDGTVGSTTSSAHITLPTSTNPMGGRTGQAKERMFDIETANLSPAQSPENFTITTDTCRDAISCTAVTDRYLAVARKSGTISRYTLPHLTPENVYNVSSEPFRMEFNCTSSRLAMVDVNGILNVLDLDARVEEFSDAGEGKGNDGDSKSGDGRRDLDSPSIGVLYGKKLSVERKDVWDLKWAEDNSECLAVMEKTKLVIINHETAEEGIPASGYVACCRDLEVRTVTLDELLTLPDEPKREHLVTFEMKTLRDLREHISMGGLSAGQSFAQKHSHPRVWRLLAESALEELDFNTAEKAYIRREDYHGVCLVKQLRSMPDKMKARAEVAVHLRRYDEAESIYREIDRKDLAIQMRNRIGDYAKVVTLLQSGGGNDEMVRDAWDRIGDHYAEKFRWKKAVQYYTQSKNHARMADCYYRLEDFEELRKLKDQTTDGTDLLNTLANMFESVGLSDDAVDCHLRCNNPKAAVDCCVQLNQWDKALELAEQHDFPQVEGLLTRYASVLIQQEKKLEVVELYRRANKPNEASQWIAEIADDAAKKDVKPGLAKKLHVLSALEVERHRQRATAKSDLATLTMGGASAIADATAATLDTLMMTSLDTQANNTAGTAGTLAGGSSKRGRQFANAWRGAAAYHFYMMAQRQFYSGSFESAMKTSIKLCEYDDILEAKDIYSRGQA